MCTSYCRSATLCLNSYRTQKKIGRLLWYLFRTTYHRLKRIVKSTTCSRTNVHSMIIETIHIQFYLFIIQRIFSYHREYVKGENHFLFVIVLHRSELVHNVLQESFSVPCCDGHVFIFCFVLLHGNIFRDMVLFFWCVFFG